MKNQIKVSISDNKIQGLNPSSIYTELSDDLTTNATLLVEIGCKPKLVLTRHLFKSPESLELFDIHQSHYTYQIALNKTGTLVFVACFRGKEKGKLFVGRRIRLGWTGTEIEKFSETGLFRFNARKNYFLTVQKEGFTLYKYRSSSYTFPELGNSWNKLAKSSFAQRKVVDVQFLDDRTLVGLFHLEAGAFALRQWQIEQDSSCEFELTRGLEVTNHLIPVMPTQMVIADSGLCLALGSSVYLYDFDFKLCHTLRFDQRVELIANQNTVVVNTPNHFYVHQIKWQLSEFGYGLRLVQIKNKKKEGFVGLAYQNSVLCEAEYTEAPYDEDADIVSGQPSNNRLTLKITGEDHE